MTHIQFITNGTPRYSTLEGARMALEGGCRWIQLRMKDATDVEREEVALKLKEACKRYGATFIIDDDVQLVKRIKADGVHLGKNDMPVDKARDILGEEFIIGGTANTFEDVVGIYKNGADYIGCGPFRFTTTKKNLSPVLGIDGYESIIKKMRAYNISLPIIAIGGITYKDIPSLKNIGVNGIAVSGTVLAADNPVEEMKRLLNI